MARERKLQHVTMEACPDNSLPELVITGANLRIVNGLGRTACYDERGNPIPGCPNGLGNLIVGYNEPRSILGPIHLLPDVRTGSHNVVVGQRHNFSRFGGLVVGDLNTISNDFATVSGEFANEALGDRSSVSGGVGNRADGDSSSVSGGTGNTASELYSAVSGGVNNTASGFYSAVSGGRNRTAQGEFDWVAGGLFQDQ